MGKTPFVGGIGVIIAYREGSPLICIMSPPQEKTLSQIQHPLFGQSSQHWPKDLG